MPEKLSAAGQAKLKVWERLDRLLDGSSFREIDDASTASVGLESYGNEAATTSLDGILAGHGRIAGREVMVFAQDSKHLGGSLGRLHIGKLRRTIDKAVREGIPIIGLIDSAGARVQEGVMSLSETGGVIGSLMHASGVVPQIYAVMGTAVGGAAYSAAMGDFLIMIDGVSQMFAWGPGVMRAEGNVQITGEELGGTAVHMTRSGVCSVRAKDESDCMNRIRLLLSYLPQSHNERPYTTKETGSGIPFPQTERASYYDSRKLISAVFDDGSFFELQGDYARSFVMGFAKLGGVSVGVIASQPTAQDGYIDVDASDKVCRFVRVCDCFNIPILTLVDSPGFLPDPAQERDGIERHGAKMMFAYAEATVLKITVIVGRAYGGGMTGLCSKPLGIDVVFAYDSSRIQVLSLKSYLEIFHKSKLDELMPEERAKAIRELSAKYEEDGRPEVAVSLGYVDRIIKPEDTRRELMVTIRQLFKDVSAKKEESDFHRNMPV